MRRIIVAAVCFALALSIRADAAGDVELGIGFPHIFNAIYVASPNRTTGLGASAGMIYIPTMRQACGADVKISGTNFEGILRYHPFKDNFFIGGRLGYMDFSVNSVQAVNPPFYDDTTGVKVIYITPTAGWRWGPWNGFKLGAEVGVQLPLNSSRYEVKTGSGALDPSVIQSIEDGITHMAGTSPFLLLTAGYSF